MKRYRYWLGLKDGRREVFRALAGEPPTQESHPWHAAVIGPFRTKRACLFMQTNPYCRDVAEAEKLSK